MSAPQDARAGDRLDGLKMGRRHASIFGMLAGGGFFDGFDIYLAGSVLAAMLASKFSSIGGNATFISMTFFGLLIGALSAAFLGDRLGRSFTAKYSLLVYGLATVVCAIVSSFQALLWFRFIAGIGLGTVIVTSYGLWVEFVPKKSRGFWTSAMSFVINLSQPVSALLALTLIPHYGWRVLFWISGLGAIVVWLFQFRLLPESPRWLESKGRREEAERVLAQFGGSTTALAGAGRVFGQAEAAQREGATGNLGPAISLWSPGVRRVTILTIVISVLSLVTWYTFASWIPTFFVKQGISVVKSFTFSFVIMLGAIPGNALAAWLSDRVGRKKTLVVLSVVLAILGILYGYSSSPAMIMLIGFLFIMGGNILIAVTTASYIPELFPTSVRMAGSSLANAFGRGATIVSPYIIAYLYANVGPRSVFWFAFILYLIMGLFILLLGHETKQQSLEEIAKSEIAGVLGEDTTFVG
ncbi:MAG: MFS transporter [Alicyclobacillus sp.]|nr:MFS transporter [Alicyclobacillus sp.]